jgi:hypothetical protein
MREFIQQNPNRWADQIRLRRDAFNGIFIIVEGHSDKLVYSNFVNSETCQFTITDGKEQALNTIEILDNSQFTGVLAIVDADFDRLENNLPESPNILLTDDHDLEMMMLKTPALEKIINERGSEEKIKENNIREILLELGQEIGYLRWISQKNNLSLRFEGLDFGKFIKKDTLEIDYSDLIKIIKNHSQKQSLVDQEIQENIKMLRIDKHNPSQVCCGHDIMQILSLALSKAWGTCKPTDVKAENLERDLRLAYERSYFYQTELYCLVQNWQNTNFPYQVLKAISSE